MPRSPPWYRGAFILVTVAKSSDAYQHPRVSVCKMYEREGGVAQLPTDHGNPTSGAQTLLSFEFQQNVDREDHEAGEPWLQLHHGKHGKTTSAAYGGRLDTKVRVEQWGVDFELAPRLRSVDKALKMYRRRLEMLGAKASECDATTLVQALKAVWHLPVLLVVYMSTGRGFSSGKHFAKVDPDPKYPTAMSVEIEMNREEAH